MLAFSRFLLASSIVSSALATDFTVKVGANGLTFDPPFVRGVKGDKITFEFHPKNHTLTQSTLDKPCEKLTDGGDSGFMAVAADETVFPIKSMDIPDDKTALWFYCKQGNHCQQGMVFAVNPKDDAQMATFVQNAKGGAAPAPTDPTPPAGAPTVHSVKVGAGGLTFTPEELTGAKAGDIVSLEFEAGAHTFTQSTFAQPCSPLAGGFDSNAQPFVQGQAPPVVNYTITDASAPLWFYCKTGAHCKSGMVLSINATPEKSHATFKATAMGAAAPPPASGTTQSVPSLPTGAPNTGAGKVHEVAVGQGGLTFNPETLTSVAVGDQVLLTFYGGSHTFTQSTFKDPCNPLANGADSGPEPVQAGQTTGLPTFKYNVTDVSKPLWFYCRTGTHCKSGMVFSVNAGGNTTHDAFKATAMGAAPPAQNDNPNGASSRFTGGAAGLVFAAAIAGLLL